MIIYNISIINFIRCSVCGEPVVQNNCTRLDIIFITISRISRAHVATTEQTPCNRFVKKKLYTIILTTYRTFIIAVEKTAAYVIANVTARQEDNQVYRWGEGEIQFFF